MAIKRISYFSFLVALAAIATVSPCYGSGEPTGCAISTAPRAIHKSISTCFDKIARAFDYSIGLTPSFKESTLKSGRLITAQATLGYQTVRKHLEFSVHQTYSSDASLLCQIGVANRSPGECVSDFPDYNYGLQIPPDKRAGIEQKNRILRE